MNKAYKCSKSIVKIVHQWFNHNFTKLREYFLCAKKTKITLLDDSSTPRHHSAILESIATHAHALL